MAKCIAKTNGRRIELVIRKNEKGYDEFAKVLHFINQDGIQSWYGDVEDENGKEQSGLIITSQIVKGGEMTDYPIEEELEEALKREKKLKAENDELKELCGDALAVFEIGDQTCEVVEICPRLEQALKETEVKE